MIQKRKVAASELLEELRSHGVELVPDGDQLIADPVTQDQVELIRAFKRELMDILRQERKDTEKSTDKLVGRNFRIEQQQGWLHAYGLEVSRSLDGYRYFLCGTFDDFGMIDFIWRLRENDLAVLNIRLLDDPEE